jgi:hypothetical protein
MPAPLLAPRVPTAGRCWQSDRPGNGGWRSDHTPWRLDRTPWWSDHPGNRCWWSDRPPPHCPVIGCLADIRRTPHGLGVCNSTRAYRGSGIPTLLTSPSGYEGAIGTASTSVVTASEGHIGRTSGQPSSDDHAGEAELPAADRQTHLVDHLIVATLSDAHLHPRCPRRPGPGAVPWRKNMLL